MTSTNTIRHYWGPNQNVLNLIQQFCINNKYKRISEIGPGIIPFSLATEFIGYNEKIPNYINIDIDETKLPYADKEIDFIYCRHTMEDILNPIFAIKEMIRCCNSGYIETPSPLIEATKGVDASIEPGKEMLYCGYHHHNSIIWSNIEKSEIYILPKRNVFLDHFLYFENKEKHTQLLNEPLLWNNYFIWKDKEPKVIMYKHFYDINTYTNLVSRAINESIENTKYFIEYINKIV
jgi:ubiquinone/menaquinone biosynthesis C-methylase UbiE